MTNYGLNLLKMALRPNASRLAALRLARIVCVGLVVLMAICVPTRAQVIETRSDPAYVIVQNMDVAGDQITVEALVKFDQTQQLRWDIVSKHDDIFDVNYLLRPFSFELTALQPNGGTRFIQLFNPVSLVPNRWYHIAGTYDGQMVRYFVDGCEVAAQPFSGNLFQNRHPTYLMNGDVCICDQHFGLADEVRIWRTARTREELVQFRYNVPDPQDESHLVAYYKFDGDLTNAQGNTNFNGTAVGNVRFSAEVPDIAVPEVQIFVDTPLCPGELLATVSIVTSDPNATSTINNISIGQLRSTMLPAGTHTIIVNYSTGCSVIQSFDVNFVATPPLESTLDKSICSGDSFEGYSQAGVHTDTFQVNGCDSIRILNLEVVTSLTQVVIDTICGQQSSHGYTEPGVYRDNFLSNFGCDSVRTLILRHVDTLRSRTFATICSGENYLGYTAAGSYRQVAVTDAGCDSVAVHELTVLDTFLTRLDISACQGDTVQGFAESGDFQLDLTSSAGCDSTVLISLNIAEVYSDTFKRRICRDPIVLGPLTIDTAGVFLHTFTSIDGCDSLVVYDVILTDLDRLGPDTILCTADSYQIFDVDFLPFEVGARIFDRGYIVSSSEEVIAAIPIDSTCVVLDSVNVAFGSRVYLPTAFSPNGDAVNDFFKPEGSQASDVFDCQIFDRWGELVFKSVGAAFAWNGFARDQLMDAQVFVALIKIYRLGCPDETLVQELMLVR